MNKIIDFVKGLPPWTAVIPVGVAALVWFGASQYDRGLSVGETKNIDASLKAIRDSLVSARKVYHTDTVRLTKVLDHRDSIAKVSNALERAHAALDSMAAIPGTKPETVTVSAPAVLIIADSAAIKQSRVVIADGQHLLTLERQRGDSLERKVKILTPTLGSRFAPKLGLGITVGIERDGTLEVVAGVTFGIHLP